MSTNKRARNSQQLAFQPIEEDSALFHYALALLMQKSTSKIERAKTEYWKIQTEAEWARFRVAKIKDISNFEITSVDDIESLMRTFQAILPGEFDQSNKEHIKLLRQHLSTSFIDRFFPKIDPKACMYQLMNELFDYTARQYLLEYLTAYQNKTIGSANFTFGSLKSRIGSYSLDNNGGNGRCELISIYPWISPTLYTFLLRPDMEKYRMLTQDDLLYVGSQVALSITLEQTRDIYETTINMTPVESRIKSLLSAYKEGQLLDEVNKSKVYRDGLVMLFQGAARVITNSIMYKRVIETLEEWELSGEINGARISESRDLDLIRDVRRVLTDVCWRRPHYAQKGMNQTLNYEINGYDRLAANVPILLVQKYAPVGIFYRRLIIRKDLRGKVIDQEIRLYICSSRSSKMYRIDHLPAKLAKLLIEKDKVYVFVSTGKITKRRAGDDSEEEARLCREELVNVQYVLAANRPNGEAEYVSNGVNGPRLELVEQLLDVPAYQQLAEELRTEQVRTRALGHVESEIKGFKELVSDESKLVELDHGLIHTNYFMHGSEIVNILVDRDLSVKYGRKWLRIWLFNN